MAKSKNFRKTSKQINEAKKFFQREKLVAISSDKTKKLVIENSNDITSRTEKILADSKTYKPIQKSRQTSISKQANKITKSFAKNLSKQDSLRLLTTGCRPAKFHALVKDHKDPDESGFPLRPIAAVNNTATEKVDWLVSQILGQLVQFVPANLKNADDLVEKLKMLDFSLLTEDHCFVSLDVVKLYPSIPIDFGIRAVLDMAELHWKDIDNFGASVDDLKRALSFVSYNYEIEFNGSVYLQKKGCPMGAHFAPPFAIITLHKIESQAIQILTEKFDFKPQIFSRYIDDVCFGPCVRENDMFDNVLNVFNSINDSIQFTIEIPKVGQPLNFLDLSIIVVKQNIRFTWYTKECHSEIILKPDSWLPRHVKLNFVANSVRQVAKKCSDSEMKSVALETLGRRLKSNGYNNINFEKILDRPRYPKKDEDCVFLQTNFINDRFNKRINQIVHQYNFPVKIISKPNKKLSQCFRDTLIKTKHENCNTCRSLPDNYNCNDRFIVYKFKCNICLKFYIGETCRPFHQRFEEHKRSLLANDKKSALSDHVFNHHPNEDLDLSNFQLCVLASCRNPVETRLKEAQLIAECRPQLNRRHELTQW